MPLEKLGLTVAPKIIQSFTRLFPFVFTGEFFTWEIMQIMGNIIPVSASRAIFVFVSDKLRIV